MRRRATAQQRFRMTLSQILPRGFAERSLEHRDETARAFIAQAERHRLHRVAIGHALQGKRHMQLPLPIAPAHANVLDKEPRHRALAQPKARAPFIRSIFRGGVGNHRLNQGAYTWARRHGKAQVLPGQQSYFTQDDIQYPALVGVGGRFFRKTTGTQNQFSQQRCHGSNTTFFWHTWISIHPNTITRIIAIGICSMNSVCRQPKNRGRRRDPYIVISLAVQGTTNDINEQRALMNAFWRLPTLPSPDQFARLNSTARFIRSDRISFLTAEHQHLQWLHQTLAETRYILSKMMDAVNVGPTYIGSSDAARLPRREDPFHRADVPKNNIFKIQPGDANGCHNTTRSED